MKLDTPKAIIIGSILIAAGFFFNEEIQKGLRKEFDAQLEKMSMQDKHRFKDTRDKWQYAYNKVTKTKKINK